MVERAEKRDLKGRFTHGNTAAVGRRSPRVSHTRALREAFHLCVEPEDIEEVARTLIAKAKEGDIRATIVLLDRCLGKPDTGTARSRSAVLEASIGVAEILARIAGRHLPPEAIYELMNEISKELDERQSHGFDLSIDTNIARDPETPQENSE